MCPPSPGGKPQSLVSMVLPLTTPCCLRLSQLQYPLQRFCVPFIHRSTMLAAVLAGCNQVGRDGKGAQPDTLVLCAGRTMRLGPGPDYVNFWYSAGCGLERLDAWDESSRETFAALCSALLRCAVAGVSHIALSLWRLAADLVGVALLQAARATAGREGAQSSLRWRTPGAPAATRRCSLQSPRRRWRATSTW